MSQRIDLLTAELDHCKATLLQLGKVEQQLLEDLDTLRMDRDKCRKDIKRLEREIKETSYGCSITGGI